MGTGCGWHKVGGKVHSVECGMGVASDVSCDSSFILTSAVLVSIIFESFTLPIRRGDDTGLRLNDHLLTDRNSNG